MLLPLANAELDAGTMVVPEAAAVACPGAIVCPIVVSPGEEFSVGVCSADVKASDPPTLEPTRFKLVMAWVLPPIITAVGVDSKDMGVPETVIACPGINVCPFMM